MRLELLVLLGVGTEATGTEIKRDISATAVRTRTPGGVVLEIGPADGWPHARLVFSVDQAA